jgi:hypothetical protein
MPGSAAADPGLFDQLGDGLPVVLLVLDVVPWGGGSMFASSFTAAATVQ